MTSYVSMRNIQTFRLYTALTPLLGLIIFNNQSFVIFRIHAFELRGYHNH